LVEGRRNPIFDACRALLARGITGRLEVWRPGKQSCDTQLNIECGALFAIRETAKESLRLIPGIRGGVPTTQTKMAFFIAAVSRRRSNCRHQ
jgi:hypothetical protein